MVMRRFEILLPATFNDGRDIADACMKCVPDTLMEVVERYGALSIEAAATTGIWTTMGRRYDDRLHRLTIDVPDTDDNRRWMSAFKTELLRRFDQLEIYAVTHLIDVL